MLLLFLWYFTDFRISSEKVYAYEKDLGFILLKLKRFDEAFSNPTRTNDIEFCYEALKAILSTDGPNGDQKNLVNIRICYS